MMGVRDGKIRRGVNCFLYKGMTERKIHVSLKPDASGSLFKQRLEKRGDL